MYRVRNELFVASHDGSSPRKITQTSARPQQFSFAPDGRRFRFTDYDANTSQTTLWEARMDGSGLHLLLPGWREPPQDCCGQWNSDGKYFFFLTTRDATNNVWVLPDESSFWRKPLNTPAQMAAGPLHFSELLPSKDGKRLFAVGVKSQGELVRYDAKSEQFVPYLGGISAGYVELSRDEQWATYVAYPEGTLWRSKVDGTERLQLTYPPLRAALPHWSPDGRRIAFCGSLPGKNWKIYVIPADGGSADLITNNKWSETDPSWSPDGTSLVFGGNYAEISVKLIDLKTRQLSTIEGSKGLFGPRWSPDGKYIAAISADNSKLELFDTVTRQWKEIGPVPGGQVGYLDWSGDSAYVYTDTMLAKDPGYLRIRIRDGKIERLMDFKNIRTYPGEFGPPSWTGLGPGGMPLVVRDISSQEIYALDLELP